MFSALFQSKKTFLVKKVSKRIKNWGMHLEPGVDRPDRPELSSIRTIEVVLVGLGRLLSFE